MGLTFFTLIVLGLIPSFTWLAFYIREDLRHPEPKWFIALAFVGGILVTFAVLPVQIVFNEQFTRFGIEKYSMSAFLILSAIEELFKFFVVYILLHKRREFDEPLHAMIYMITAALGFAASENIASLIKASEGSLLNVAILESLTLRFIGATLLHTLTSGLVGYYWGLAFIRGSQRFILEHRREFFLILKGLLIATLLHSVFNYLIIKTGPASFAIVFVVFVAFFILGDFEKFKKEDI